MGVFFNDPEVELDDIYWYHVLTHEIVKSLRRGFQIVVISNGHSLTQEFIKI